MGRWVFSLDSRNLRSMENGPRKHVSALKKGKSMENPWPAVENNLSGSRPAGACRGRRGPLADLSLTSGFEQIERYLRHVEETGGGYDVGIPFDHRLIARDCRPMGPIKTLKKRQPYWYKCRVRRPTRSVIKQINAEEGRNFKLVEIVNGVKSRCQMVYLTFTVKDDAADSEETIQVIVATPFGRHHGPFEIKEWRFKPDVLGGANPSP